VGSSDVPIVDSGLARRHDGPEQPQLRSIKRVSCHHQLGAIAFSPHKVVKGDSCQKRRNSQAGFQKTSKRAFGDHPDYGFLNERTSIVASSSPKRPPFRPGHSPSPVRRKNPLGEEGRSDPATDLGKPLRRPSQGCQIAPDLNAAQSQGRRNMRSGRGRIICAGTLEICPRCLDWRGGLEKVSSDF
jgi:hypothetical protein